LSFTLKNELDYDGAVQDSTVRDSERYCMDAVLNNKLFADRGGLRMFARCLVPCVFVLASAASLLIDVPFVLVFENKYLPAALDRPLKEALENCEPFGHGFGVTLIVISIAVLSSGGAGMQSFPSAHTATAVGLAVMLVSLFPRGRWLFPIIAVLVGMQRIATSAHFPSDVFAGATVGWVFGSICAHSMMSYANNNDPTFDDTLASKSS
jgi:membrane-associated phospholipid phosphatase